MFLLVSIAVCFLASQHAVEAASCHLREIDLCVATVLLGASEGVPVNDEDIDKICEPVQEGFDCIGNYSATCFTPLMQEVFDMVIVEPRNAQREFCSHGSDARARYLKNAPCFQKVLSGDNMRPQIEDMMAALEAATEAEFQKRIPIMCCGIQRMFAAAIGMVEDQCGKGVLEEGGMMLGISVSSISEIFCRGYEPSSPKCTGILPPPGTPSKGSESKLQLIQFMNTALANLQ